LSILSIFVIGGWTKGTGPNKKFQFLAGQSREQVADYRRLLNEIDEEVLTLQALEEVKFGDTLVRQY
jgi:hypothetical protein